MDERTQSEASHYRLDTITGVLGPGKRVTGEVQELVHDEQVCAFRCRRAVRRVAITNMVGLPWRKAESRPISQFNFEEPAQAKDDMSFGTPVIGNISRGVLDHTDPDIFKYASPPEC